MPKKRACDTCRSKKIQCDRALPKCDWCWHHGLSCTYEWEARSRIGKSTYVSGRELSRRIERIELAFSSLQQRNANSCKEHQVDIEEALQISESQGKSIRDSSTTSSDFHLDGPWRPLRVGLSEVHFAGHYMGDVSPSASVPTFSRAGLAWIRLRTGQEPSFPSFRALGNLPEPVKHRQSPILELAPSDKDAKLPPREVLESFLPLYYPSIFHKTLPVIDRVLFSHTIDVAYSAGNGVPRGELAAAKACIFSLMTLLSICQRTWPSLPPIDGDMFEGMARKLLPEFYLNTTTDAFQAIHMLCLFHLLSGRPQEGASLHSLSARIIMALGASSSPEIVTAFSRANIHDEEQRRNRHLRRLFWLSYVVDKKLALQIGQPPSIDDDYCDLTLPEEILGSEGSESTDIHFWEYMTTEEVMIPGDPRLSIIMSRICKSLYSTSALRLDDTALLKNVRELDQVLENWRLSIPASHRPSLGSTVQRAVNHRSTSPHMDMLRSVMQLKYCHLLAAIHLACGHCKGWCDERFDQMQGVSSSIAISVEASRSLLVQLHTDIEGYPSESFWMTIFFPLSAVVNLFCSILLDPADPQMQEDLQLIQSVPQLARGMKSRCLKPHDEDYLKSLDRFITELVRLGNCAVVRTEKAQNLKS